MLRLHIPRRVMDDLEMVAGSADGEIVGGLLVGSLTPVGYWVHRILAVRNHADPEIQPNGFAVDPRAMVNVRRTLLGSGRSVIGVSTASAAADELPYDFGTPIDPEPVRLHISGDGAVEAALTIDGDRRSALQVEVVPDPMRTALACPD